LYNVSFTNSPIRNKAHKVALLTILLLAVTSVAQSPSSAAANASRFYANTGYSVSGAFLVFFDKYGGVNIFGYPISAEVVENGRTVQYFERQRFEHHSEATGTPHEVQLSRLGAEMAAGKSLSTVAPFASKPNRLYIPQTRHSLSAAFLSYWRAYGGVRVFGYPISEPVAENGRTMQYFERARMEHHPDKVGQAYGIQLGLLGREYLRAHPDLAARVEQASRRVTPVARGGQPQVEQSKPGELSAREEELQRLINEARRAADLNQVGLDGTLRNIALSRSQDMAKRGYFSHVTPEGTDFLAILRNAGVPYKLAGEIISNNNYGDGEASQQAFNSFMNSPRHKAILLDSRYTLAGVGAAKDGRGFHFFTVIFIQR
jgi:uncharacterized protein YkwD